MSFSYWPKANARAFRWTALAEDWVSRGKQVTVVCAWAPGLAAEETVNGVQVHRVGFRMLEAIRGGVARTRAASTKPQGAAAASGIPFTARLRHTLRRAALALWHGTYWPDTACLWYLPALRKARALSAAAKADAVVSVAPEFTAVAVGYSLAKRARRGCRWLIDLGDPFSFSTDSPPNNIGLYGGLNRWFERRCFARAAAVTVTNPSTRTRYAALFPESAAKIEVIPPLFALPQRGGIRAAGPADGRLRLVYLGRLYPTIRKPDFLLALFERLLAQPGMADATLHFYGDTAACAESFARHASRLGAHLLVHGQVPRDQVPAIMDTASALVNIGNDTEYQLPSKLVEYVATGRPILNLAPSSEDSSALFLTTHPCHLTISSTAGEPSTADVAALHAFLLDAARRTAALDLSAWLEPYRLPAVSSAYLRILEGGGAGRT